MRQSLVYVFFLCLPAYTTAQAQNENMSGSIVTEIFVEQEDFISTMALVKDWLFVIKSFQTSEHYLHVFDTKTGEKVYEFIRPGRGPGEYVNFTIRRGPESHQLEIVDKGVFKNDIYDVPCLQKKLPVSRAHTCIVKTVNNNSANVNAVVLENDLIFNHSMTGEGTLFLSRGEQRIQTLAAVPEEIEKTYPRPTMASMATTGRLVANPDRTRIGFFADSYDRIMIFERRNNAVEQVMDGGYSWVPEFKVENHGRSGLLRTSPNTRIAFKSVDSGNTYIYTLYSGKAEKDLTEEERINGSDRRYFSNRVKVFDWKGNEVKEIRLDREIYELAVDPEEDYLYGVYNENEEWGIIRVSLN